jgi:hypothetical protein
MTDKTIQQKLDAILLAGPPPEPTQDCSLHPQNQWTRNKDSIDPFYVCFECAYDKWVASGLEKEIESLLDAVLLCNRMLMHTASKTLKQKAWRLRWDTQPYPTIASTFRKLNQSSPFKGVGGSRTLRMRRYSL